MITANFLRALNFAILFIYGAIIVTMTDKYTDYPEYLKIMTYGLGALSALLFATICVFDLGLFIPVYIGLLFVTAAGLIRFGIDTLGSDSELTKVSSDLIDYDYLATRDRTEEVSAIAIILGIFSVIVLSMC